MSMWKAALLGVLIPVSFVLPAMAQDSPPRSPEIVFEELDLNGDGAITLEEMTGAGDARFAEADANGNGTLDRDELLARAQERAERGVDRMIERVDANGDGALSQEEMANMREGRRGPNPARMFERIDADGDGSISQGEFETALETMRERRGGFGGQHNRG